MSNMNKRILISCPVSSRGWVLPYYLEHIYNISYDKKLIDIYWIINNSNDESFSILSKFQKQFQNEYNSIKIEIYNNSNMPKDERKNSVRKQYTYSWLSELRNKILKKCVELNCDYLFSVDCDILVPEYILARLLSSNKDICASLIYNGYLYDSVENAYKYPNILKEISKRQYTHIVNYRTKNPDKNEIGKIIPVDFTGACVLMSQDVCNKTKYEWHDQGEDEPWSWSARQAGFELWCDVSCYSQHIMSKDILELYLQGKLTQKPLDNYNLL